MTVSNRDFVWGDEAVRESRAGTAEKAMVRIKDEGLTAVTRCSLVCCFYVVRGQPFLNTAVAVCLEDKLFGS